MRPPVNPGTVVWSGENPCIDLREAESGPATFLMTYFRVLYSPHGRGHAVVFLTDPMDPVQAPGHINAMYTDNTPLGHWLLETFVQDFPQYRRVAGIPDLPVKSGRNFRRADENDAYVELADSDDGEIRLSWSRMRVPFLIELPPAESPAGDQEIFSLTVPADAADASIGEFHARGVPFATDVCGTPSSSAFLAFGETWVKPVV
ncbi:MAG: hypothetical protein ACXVBV_18715 [Isosphaeraceae bacterium]